MANSNEIARYKDDIINTILNDFELIKLIDDMYVDEAMQSTVDADQLRYNNIFPYYYKPNTTTEAKSFIIMSVDIPRIQDSLIKDMLITITVVAHQSLMKVDFGDGTRIDQMGACVDRLFNGKSDLGFGYVSLDSNYELSVNDSFRCRVLKFKVEEFNQSRCY